MSFKSTIITSPDEDVNLKRDIRLIKLSLLYSDQITLVSPKTSLIVAMIHLGILNSSQQLEFIKEIAPTLQPGFNLTEFDDAIKRINILRQRKGKSKQDIAIIGKFDSYLRTMNEGFKQMGQNFLDESNFEQLLPLIDQGILTLKDFDVTVNKEGFPGLVIKEIVEALSMSSSSYPVFDDLVGSLAYHYSKENNMQFSRQNADEIEFSKELIFHLPNIDSISITEILILKEELTTELARYKSLVMDYSKELESPTFSNESKAEIKKQFEYKIKPEIERLREQIKANTFFKHLIGGFMNDFSSNVTKASIYMAACKIADLQEMLSAVGILGETTYKAIKELKDEKVKIKQNPIYFYNKLHGK